MQIGFWSCMALAITFFIIGIWFWLLKEKAAKWIFSGFSSLSSKEQALYDKTRLALDMRNLFLLWAVILLIGALLSYFFISYWAIPAFAIWLVLFFRQVHGDAHKAFEKYLRK